MNFGRLVFSAVMAVVAVAGIVSAVWTVIPDPSTYVARAVKVSALGYPSHCPFAPYSTIISVGITVGAAVIYLIVRRFFWR